MTEPGEKKHKINLEKPKRHKEVKGCFWRGLLPCLVQDESTKNNFHSKVPKSRYEAGERCPKKCSKHGSSVKQTKYHLNRESVLRHNPTVMETRGVQLAKSRNQRASVPSYRRLENMPRLIPPVGIDPCEYLNQFSCVFIKNLKNPIPKDPLCLPKRYNVWVPPPRTREKYDVFLSQQTSAVENSTTCKSVKKCLKSFKRLLCGRNNDSLTDVTIIGKPVHMNHLSGKDRCQGNNPFAVKPFLLTGPPVLSFDFNPQVLLANTGQNMLVTHRNLQPKSYAEPNESQNSDTPTKVLVWKVIIKDEKQN